MSMSMPMESGTQKAHHLVATSLRTPHAPVQHTLQYRTAVLPLSSLRSVVTRPFLSSLFLAACNQRPKRVSALLFCALHTHTYDCSREIMVVYLVTTVSYCTVRYCTAVQYRRRSNAFDTTTSLCYAILCLRLSPLLLFDTIPVLYIVLEVLYCIVL